MTSFHPSYSAEGIPGDFESTTMAELVAPVEYDWGTVRSLRNEDKLEEGILISFPPSHQHPPLRISTLLPPSSLAPLFSGSEWAGTRLWAAATHLSTHFHKTYVLPPSASASASPSFPPLASASLIELGCGLGVPGMLAKVWGARKVVLTEMDVLVELGKGNVESNFANGPSSSLSVSSEGAGVEARELDWSRSSVVEVIENSNGGRSFDYILVTDCVYEPLYGDSWKHLVEVCDELLIRNPHAVCLHSMERRAKDGIDKFLAAMADLESVDVVEKVGGEGVIELYLFHGKK